MKSAKADFVHLHVHTAYSLLESTLHLEDLFKKALEYQMPAIAITDHGNLFGVIDFYRQAHKFGIKPIIGCELHVAPKSRLEKSSPDATSSSYHLVVLAKNIEGYKNLLKLSTLGYLEGFYFRPRVDKQLLKELHKGLIATSACRHGEIAAALIKGDRDGAIQAAREYRDIFGAENFYLEIMENGLPDQSLINKGILEISRLLSIPVVATNDCHYLQARDAEAHDVLKCIRYGKTLNDKKRMDITTKQLYLRTPEEMKKLFSHCPEAIANTVLIAEQCNLDLEPRHSDPFRSQNIITPANRFKEWVKNSMGEILSSNRKASQKEHRDMIFRHLMEKVGSNRVAHVISFRKMRARTAIRDVGRVMKMPDTEVEAILKMIPKGCCIYLRDAVSQEPFLLDAARNNKKIDKLLKLSQALEGLNVQSSVHSSKFIISDSPLIEMIPLYCSPNGELITQYCLNDLKELGINAIFDFVHDEFTEDLCAVNMAGKWGFINREK